ncbi:MAG: hypothetical protein QNJ13_11390 [Paracoccaceae bacterium]|nr:hypothetical protein [Paracoccaceae bacterium]
MVRFFLALALALTAQPGGAQTLDGGAFDALTRGRTVIYSLGGEFHGMERHFGDRRVEWAFSDGECFAGRWYEAGDNICFEYENLDGPQCWQFTEAPGGFLATFIDGETRGSTFVARLTDAPMTCTGPRVGV